MFAGRCFPVRNRSQPSASVRIRSIWHCRWGELQKVTFHGCVLCQIAPLFHCDLHESGMSCKKGDAFRCTGAAFRESDTFASQLYWELQFQSGVLEVLNRAVPLGFAVARWLEKLCFCDKSQVKRRFCSQCVRAEVVKIISNARKKVTILHVLRKVTKVIFRGRRSTL